jgi:hypothetical protein
MRGPASTSVLLLCLTLFGRGVPQECGETCSAERVAETKIIVGQGCVTSGLLRRARRR